LYLDEYFLVYKHFSLANTSLSFDHISRHSHKAILVISASNAWYLGQVPYSWETSSIRVACIIRASRARKRGSW